MGTITELWRYPVKSMQGERIDTAEVTNIGIVGDRAWAVVDAETGHVASAKHPRKWGTLLGFQARTIDASTAQITLPDGTVARTDDPDIDDALSSALGRGVRLASAAPPDRHFEAVYPPIEGVLPEEFLAENKTGEEQEGTVVDVGLGLAAPPGTFFDLAVLHLITEATLEKLAVDVRRFRPNIVVAGDDAPFAENDWMGRTLTLGATITAPVVIPAMRCVMTTLPQPGLPQDRGVLQAVARDNRVEIPGIGTWACAGVYTGVGSAGSLGVGDAVSIS